MLDDVVEDADADPRRGHEGDVRRDDGTTRVTHLGAQVAYATRERLGDEDEHADLDGALGGRPWRTRLTRRAR